MGADAARGLAWRDLGWALAGPALYLAYALVRGSLDGWYPYYSLDLIIVFGVIGASAIALDRRLAARDVAGRPADLIRG